MKKIWYVVSEQNHCSNLYVNKLLIIHAPGRHSFTTVHANSQLWRWSGSSHSSFGRANVRSGGWAAGSSGRIGLIGRAGRHRNGINHVRDLAKRSICLLRPWASRESPQLENYHNQNIFKLWDRCLGVFQISESTNGMFIIGGDIVTLARKDLHCTSHQSNMQMWEFRMESIGGDMITRRIILPWSGLWAQNWFFLTATGPWKIELMIPKGPLSSGVRIIEKTMFFMLFSISSSAHPTRLPPPPPPPPSPLLFFITLRYEAHIVFRTRIMPPLPMTRDVSANTVRSPTPTSSWAERIW